MKFYNILILIILVSVKPVQAYSTLTITSGEKTHHFTYELADTPEKQEKGLMFRTSLPDMHGMLFVFETPRIAHFWMKNTLIPLDMLFADASGKILYIHAMATPESREIISSGVPAKSVFEVNGGTAKRLGIHIGDRIHYAQ